MNLRKNWFVAGGLVALLATLFSLPLQAEENVKPVAAQTTETDAEFDILSDVMNLFKFDGSQLFDINQLQETAVESEVALHAHGKKNRTPITEEQKGELKKFAMMNGGRLKLLHASMGVTKDQRHKMKDALLKHRDNMKAKGKDIEKSIRALDAATLSNADDATIKKAADAVGTSVAGAIIELLSAFQDARGVLDDKQRASLDSTMGMIVKSFEEFETKNGMCPLKMALRAHHEKGHKGCPIGGCLKGRTHRRSGRTAQWKCQGHSEKVRLLKRMIAGNIGRVLILYSEIDITKEQEGQIKTNVKSHCGEIRTDLVSLKDNGRALVKTVLLAKDEEAKKAAANNVGTAVAAVALEITKTRQDVRKVLTDKQKEQIQKTCSEIQKSIKDFRTKVKALRKQPKA